MNIHDCYQKTNVSDARIRSIVALDSSSEIYNEGNFLSDIIKTRIFFNSELFPQAVRCPGFSGIYRAWFFPRGSLDVYFRRTLLLTEIRELSTRCVFSRSYTPNDEIVLAWKLKRLLRQMGGYRMPILFIPNLRITWIIEAWKVVGLKVSYITGWLSRERNYQHEWQF